MKKALGAAAAAAMLVLAGCGDDDDGGEGSIEAYCRLSAESETSTDFPTAEQFAEFRAAAPSEIRDDVDTLIDAFQDIDASEDPSALFQLFEDPEVAEAIENLEEFDAEHCQTGADEE